MIEILFKARRIDNGKWVEGSLLIYPDGDSFICSDDGLPDCLNKYEVDPSTVCQYTGIEDKNGVRIWSGDIVKSSCADGNSKVFVFSYDDTIVKTLEVIGSIHTSPELLGED